MTVASGAPDVAVIGGGIVGCSLAAFLAEAGARVRVLERDTVAAAASGRNSGAIQHPMEAALAGLHEATLALYAGLDHGFALPAEPAGVLLVADDAARVEAVREDLARRFAELTPERLEGAALQAAEPALAGDLAACRLRTGYPVPPGPAQRTPAWPRRARRSRRAARRRRGRGTAWRRGSWRAASGSPLAPWWWPPVRGRRR